MGYQTEAAALATCSRHFEHLSMLADWFILVSLVAATLTAVLSLLAQVRTWRKRADERASLHSVEAGVDALKGLVSALATAPTWFAIFIAGFALLWIADRYSPTECAASAPTDQQDESTAM